MDLEIPGPIKFYPLRGEAVYHWQVDEEAIDKAARRILRSVLLSGHMGGTVSTGLVNTTAQQMLARNQAKEAINLLKNEHNVLPITNKVKKIAVIGPNAVDAVIAGGSSSHVDPLYRISPLEGLKKLLDDKVEILYEQGCSNYDEPSKDDRLARAVAIARKADIALVFIGYPESFETECWVHPHVTFR
jgi:beta-glucosidase